MEIYHRISLKTPFRGRQRAPEVIAEVPRHFPPAVLDGVGALALWPRARGGPDEPNQRGRRTRPAVLRGL